MRIEWAKEARTRTRRIGKVRSLEFEAERKKTEEALTDEIEETHEWDAYLLMVGGVMLAFHFLLQIPYEMELVHRDELSHELTKFKIEHIDPINEQLRD